MLIPSVLQPQGLSPHSTPVLRSWGLLLWMREPTCASEGSPPALSTNLSVAWGSTRETEAAETGTHTGAHVSVPRQDPQGRTTDQKPKRQVNRMKGKGTGTGTGKTGGSKSGVQCQLCASRYPMELRFPECKTGRGSSKVPPRSSNKKRQARALSLSP